MFILVLVGVKNCFQADSAKDAQKTETRVASGLVLAKDTKPHNKYESVALVS